LLLGSVIFAIFSCAPIRARAEGKVNALASLHLLGVRHVLLALVLWSGAGAGTELAALGPWPRVALWHNLGLGSLPCDLFVAVE